MAELKDRLRADLTSAMKSQDKLRTATLRMVLAAIQTEEVAGKESRELSDADVIKVLSREAKKRAESAEIYTQNGRGELAATEHAEARIIDEYLPPRSPRRSWQTWSTPRSRRSPSRSVSGRACGRWAR
jgi:uncharacterized protein